MNVFVKILIAIGQLIAAVVIGTIAIGIGAIYGFLRAIYQFSGPKIFKVIWYSIKETLLVFVWIITRLAIGIDILGNTVAGELIEDLVTAEEHTLFGKSGITVSAALGELYSKNKLNKTGLFLCQMLDWFDPNHVQKSYENYKLRKSYHDEIF